MHGYWTDTPRDNSESILVLVCTSSCLVRVWGSIASSEFVSLSLQISVHVQGSNYTHTSEPFKRTAVIPFHQPPTIIADSPSNISVKTNISFSLQISSTSNLDVQLRYDHLVTTPPELANDITFDVSPSGRVATISGVISLSTLSQILKQHVDVPTVSIRVTDTYGGYIVPTTELLIQDQAPIFNQSQYIFNIPENKHVTIIGTFSVIDPNSDPLDQSSYRQVCRWKYEVLDLGRCWRTEMCQF